ncbi:MAG: hypothetical protein IPO92_03340 [Saprospiraceae bacterium]|nr:hypothetical protein [Saprospiraceae bacterium]
MQHYKKIFFLLLLNFFLQKLYAQEVIDKPVDGTIFDFGIGLGYNIPTGVLADRYGNNLNFSLGGDYITNNNWVFNPEFLYLFGTTIKEDVLAPFRSKEGFLLGDDNQDANVIFKERGLYLGLGIGKIFPFKSNSRSGLKVVVSGGLLQHAIIFADERNSLAQIRAGRHIGYDRLTRGFSTKQTVAYKYLGKDRRLNFEFALDFIQGFTSEVRAINFDTGLPGIKSRLDLLFGFRFIWNIPYYKGGEATVFY